MEVSIKYKDGEKDTVKVSVENGDLWDMDVTLARVIFPVLKKYRKLYDRKNGHTGMPMDFAANPCEPEGPENVDRLEDWLICLDKMVYSFGWLAKGRGWEGPVEDEFFKEYDRCIKAYKKEMNVSFRAQLSFDEQMKIIRPIAARYQKQFDDHHTKIQEGINLFAKYYGALWL